MLARELNGTSAHNRHQRLFSAITVIFTINKLEGDQIYILCSSLRISSHLPALFLSGTGDRLWKCNNFKLSRSNPPSNCHCQQMFIQQWPWTLTYWPINPRCSFLSHNASFIGQVWLESINPSSTFQHTQFRTHAPTHGQNANTKRNALYNVYLTYLLIVATLRRRRLKNQLQLVAAT